PISHGDFRSRASLSVPSVASPTASRSPSSHAASALAAATGPRRGSSPVGSANAHASSSAAHCPGSPRRARSSPSTTSDQMLGEPRTPAALEALLELLVILLAHTDRRERVDRDLRIVEALREIERAPTPGDRLLRTHCVLTVRRKRGVRQGELAARRQAFEQC